MASIIDLNKTTNKIKEIIFDKYHISPTIYENLNYKNINIEDLIKTTTYLLNLKKAKTDISVIFSKEENKNIIKDLYSVGLKTITKKDFTEQLKYSLNTAEESSSSEEFFLTLFLQHRKINTTIVIPDNEDTEDIVLDITQVLEINGFSNQNINRIINNIQTYPEIDPKDLLSISDISVYISKHYYL